MATDIGEIVENLVSFYDFRGKDVVHVGAGGGQLIGYAHLPRKITAIDNDRSAVERLTERVRASGLEDRFSVVEGDFFSVRAQADVVFLEFCLHEMADPALAIAHAASMAPRTLIIDHMRESEWSWFACETNKVSAGWNAVERLPALKRMTFEAKQRFDGYKDLSGRLQELGEESMRRIRRFESRRDIEISMPYAIVLL
jgi:ubiquinone/menaquinone biosynthesis C-methylase UbiE